jgi:hypothetical protein
LGPSSTRHFSQHRPAKEIRTVFVSVLPQYRQVLSPATKAAMLYVSGTMTQRSSGPQTEIPSAGFPRRTACAFQLPLDNETAVSIGSFLGYVASASHPSAMASHTHCFNIVSSISSPLATLLLKISNSSLWMLLKPFVIWVTFQDTVLFRGLSALTQSHDMRQ